jgi:hypothetical protein
MKINFTSIYYVIIFILKKLFDFLSDKERYIFLLLVIFNLKPIFAGFYFPTLDGPAHLYNSNIINQLIFFDNIFLSDYYVLNKELIPNWTSHFILSILNLIFPAYLSEKILLSAFLIGFPYSFRVLIKSQNKKNLFMSYLFIPFTYTFFLFLGFYNFIISLIFIPLILNYWLKIKDRKLNLKSSIFFSFLLIATYFSHIFSFIIVLTLIGLNILIEFIMRINISDNLSFKKAFLNSLDKVKLLITNSFIPLVLLIMYFSKRNISDGGKNFEFQTLVEYIYTIRPLVGAIPHEEIPINIYFVVLILFLAILSFGMRIYNLKKSTKQLINKYDFLLFGAILFLFLYFMLPDSDGNGGYISLRLCLSFFVIFLMWLSFQKISKYYSLLIITIVFIHTSNKNQFFYDISENLNSLANDCEIISKSIEPNTVVLPINFSDNFLHGHISNYLANNKPIMILDNYECSTGYFPVKWNQKDFPMLYLGNINNTKFDCLTWKNSYNNTNSKVIDYVFVMGKFNLENQCNVLIKENIDIYYSLIDSTNFCKLYKFNSNIL